MIDARFRPLGAPAYKSRRRAPFRVNYGTRLDLLEQELSKLRARNIVIEAGFSLEKIRNDGWPRSGATPTHPAVVLHFDSRNGHIAMPCDTYDRFEDNLYAVALSLEALRAVDRYGVTKNAEQYKGWTALPANDGKMNADAARALIAGLAGVPVSAVVSGDLEILYRAAAKRAHPDTPDGSHEAFTRLQEAMRVLRG